MWFVCGLPTAALFWVANRPTPAPPSSLHLAFSQAADFVERQQQLQQTFCTEKAAAAGNQFCTPAAVPHTQTPLAAQIHCKLLTHTSTDPVVQDLTEKLSLSPNILQNFQSRLKISMPYLSTKTRFSIRSILFLPQSPDPNSTRID